MYGAAPNVRGPWPFGALWESNIPKSLIPRSHFAHNLPLRYPRLWLATIFEAIGIAS
jgi:hypothetical protein